MSDPEIVRLRREIEKLTREKEAAEAREEQLIRENQPTTLDEYLRNCHTYLYQNFKLADKSISSTGFTRVDGKFYPKWLRPWTEFAESLRQQQFNVIMGACEGERLFNQESTTRDIGRSISHKLAGNESAVTHFEKVAVEDPTYAIFQHLAGLPAIRTRFRFSDLRFSDNSREITQASGGIPLTENEGLDNEIPERRPRTGPNKRAASEQRVKPRPTNPDGAGLRTRPGGDESVAFVYDYKAAHKVSVEHVKLAVAKETLFIEVVEQINSNKSKTGTELDQFRAEARIAMALTQVFDYMVNYGVAYGYVAAGESLLLLYIDRADPQTLFCHPCVPNEDVGEVAGEDWAEKMIYTAVAQLASFFLLSLRSDALQGALLEASLESAGAALKKWTEPYEEAVHFVSAEDTESSLAPSSSPMQGADQDFTSKAVRTGRDIPLRSKSSCATPTLPRRDNESDEEDGPEGDLPPPWTRPVSDRGNRKRGLSDSSSEVVETHHSAPTRQYCSQACLLGLKKGWDLDDSCPNVLLHRNASGDGRRHHITADQFTHLVGERLRQNPYQDCSALDGWGKKGAIGVLFRLELPPYGYTFVGKGTLLDNLERLRHECRVYERLDTLQGYVVPVHLGLVQLEKGYILPGGERAVHMMLMSWGGESVAHAGMGTADMEAQRHRSSQAVWALGVDHNDERNDNLLWNAERQCVMLIDFDRAGLRVAPKHRQLSMVSGMKRKRVDDKSYPLKRCLLGRLQSV
ncbi:metalloprotease-like protein [Apiospora phragmitis]|uniref:Metalloprotease-like protein n=1 Tax=Apiospora phragmitis TaxID=2905665 RepID=A0ABR1SWY0_9PEZI